MNAHPREFKGALPNSVEAEQALLGAVLLNPDAWYAVNEITQPQHFFEPLHTRLWEVISARMSAGEGLQIIPLIAALGKDSGVEIAPGMTVAQYIARLAAEGTSVLGHAEYAKTVRDLWQRRRLVVLGRELEQRAAGGFDELTISDLLDETDHELNGIRNGSVLSAVTVGEAAQDAINETAAAYKHTARPGMETGLPSLDGLIGPLMPGYLITLLGPSGHGKTGLAAQIVSHACAPSFDSHRSRKGLFISQEMTARELAQRMLASQTGLSTRKQKRGDVTENEYKTLESAAASLKALPVLIDQTGRQKASRIISKLRALKRSHDIGFAVIDHLLLIQPEHPKQTRIETIENASAMFKDVAKELDICILLLAQVTREAQKRDHWRVRDTDLYGGDAVKQNSDVVFTITVPTKFLRQREPEYPGSKEHDKWLKNLDEWKDKAEIGSLKVRDGQDGIYRKLAFDGRRVTFSEDE